MKSITRKKCSECGEIKDKTGFYKDNKSRDKLTYSCKECILSKRKSDYYKNPSKYIESVKARYHKNPIPTKDRVKKWYKSHLSSVYERVKTWRINNRSRANENNKRSAHKHPENGLNSLHKRRARKLCVIGEHFTEKEWQDVLEFYGHKCLCCQKTDIPLERDHVIPLGSPHSDEISNIQPLCRSCNAKKGRKILDYRR